MLLFFDAFLFLNEEDEEDILGIGGGEDEEELDDELKLGDNVKSEGGDKDIGGIFGVLFGVLKTVFEDEIGECLTSKFSMSLKR